MKKNDKGLAELISLLISHPDLINGLVFNPANIKRLLRSSAGRRLRIGEDVKIFLRDICKGVDGDLIGVCFFSTQALCSGGTKSMLCFGGTSPDGTR